MGMNEKLEALRPTVSTRVRDLVERAGVDVSDWAINIQGEVIANPNTNTYRNSQWTFGGLEQPIVVCIWWGHLEIELDLIIHTGSAKGFITGLGDKLTSSERTPAEAQRLRNKIQKAQAFDRAISEAYRKMRPVRLILLDGETEGIETAEVASSHASKRRLDEANWYVHEYDPYSGDYKLVREVLPPSRPTPDPFGDVNDPADESDFQVLLNASELNQTVKDAMVKARVGQGFFRDSLINRWGGCAVTGCKDTSLLIASHILPWRSCTTRAERLGVSNGLLLVPTFDRAFDLALISFSDKFEVLVSAKLSPVDASYLGISPTLRLRSKEFTDIRPFLARHRQEVFQGSV